MGKLAGFVIAMLLCVAPSMALADAAGSALGVKPAADAALDGATRTLVVGSDIFIGDLIQTGPKGNVQILFADNTELVVGPSSSLTIEDYMIRNDGSAGKLVVDVLSGAFRFATGDSAKNRYVINTPTGTIGVRGTGFDGWVNPETGIAYLLHFHGIVDFCTETDVCDVLTDFCTLGEIGSTEAKILGDSRQATGAFRKALKSWFLYADNQSSLLRKFWMANARDCLNSPPVVPDHPELDDGQDNEPPVKPPGRGIKSLNP